MVRVLVVDDFTPWHTFIAAALECDPRYKVVAFAFEATRAIELCQTLSPDLILLDMNLSGSSGMVTAQKLRKIAPKAQIIFFTDHVSADFVIAAFKAGATGFVAKRDSRELLSAVNTVMSGERYLSERVQGLRLDKEREDQ